MTCGDAVELIACLLLEGTELDEAVAHHVGVGGETFAYRVHGVGGNAVVILFLQVHDVELAAVFLSDISGYLDVFLRRTVHQILLALESYLDVKDMRVNALLLEERHYH